MKPKYKTGLTVKELDKKYRSLFFEMQMEMQSRPRGYSSEHEMAIFRGVTSSKSISEAARKIDILKGGRIAQMKGKQVLEDLLINFQVNRG